MERIWKNGGAAGRKHLVLFEPRNRMITPIRLPRVATGCADPKMVRVVSIRPPSLLKRWSPSWLRKESRIQRTRWSAGLDGDCNRSALGSVGCPGSAKRISGCCAAALPGRTCGRRAKTRTAEAPSDELVERPAL